MADDTGTSMRHLPCDHCTEELQNFLRRHAVEYPPLDIIALGFGEDHAGSAVEKFAKPAEFLFC